MANLSKKLIPGRSAAATAPKKRQKNPITDKLISQYSTAYRLARQSSAPTQFVVTVGPKGTLRLSKPEESARETASQVARQQPAQDDDLQAALEEARERGRKLKAETLQSQHMLSSEDFAKLIGVTRATVNAKRNRHEVLGLEGAKRGYRYPAWQVDDNGKPYSALPDLFDRLGGDEWSVYRFLQQHHPELGGMTGIEALASGCSRAVIDAAESVARDFG